MTKRHQKALKCEPFSRVPVTITSDPRVKDSDVRVYTVMAANVWQGNVCRLSFSDLSRASTVSKRGVIRSISRLLAFGYIKASGEKRERAVTFYVLTSNVFAQKQGREDIIVSSPRGQRYVSMDNDRHGLPAREECA